MQNVKKMEELRKDNRAESQSNFDKEFSVVIGYEPIKMELKRIIDIMVNPEKYRELGVSTPKGVLIDGNPGLGKTLIANCFIKASGRKAFVCRDAHKFQ